MSLLSFVGGAGQGLARSFGGFTEFANQQTQLNADLAAKRALAEQARLNAERQRREAIVQGINNANNNLQELMSVTANVDAAQSENVNTLINERLNTVRGLFQQPEYANAWRRQFIPGVQLSEEEHRMNREIRALTAEADAIRQQAENQYAAMQERNKLLLEGKIIDNGEITSYFQGNPQLSLSSPQTSVASIDSEGLMNSLQKRVEDTAIAQGGYYVDGSGMLVNSSTQQSDPAFVRNLVYEYFMGDVNALNAEAASRGIFRGGYVPTEQRDAVARALAAEIAPTLRFGKSQYNASESADRVAGARNRQEMAVIQNYGITAENPQEPTRFTGSFSLFNQPGTTSQRIVMPEYLPTNQRVTGVTLNQNSSIVNPEGRIITDPNLQRNITNGTVQGYAVVGFKRNPLTGRDEVVPEGQPYDYVDIATVLNANVGGTTSTSGYGASGLQENTRTPQQQQTIISQGVIGRMNQAEYQALVQRRDEINSRLANQQPATSVDEIFNVLNLQR